MPAFAMSVSEGMRGCLRAVCAGLLLTTLAGCADGKSSPTNGTEASRPRTLVLDAARPEASIGLSEVTAVENAVGLQIPVLEVTNPDQKPVQVFVFLEGQMNGNRERIQLGHFAPFPPDRPGTFTVSMTAMQGLRQKGVQTPLKQRRIVLRLASLSQDVSPGGVRLRIGPVRWLYKE